MRHTREPVALHGARTGNCFRAVIALEEAGLPYTIVNVDLAEGQQRGEAHRRLDPSGRVPVIVDTSVSGEPLILTQSNAIMLYAADQAPGALLPTGSSRARAIALERFFYFVTDVIAVSHASFMVRAVESGESRPVFDARVVEMIGGAERFLADGDFLAGDALTLADISAVTIMNSVIGDLDLRDSPGLRTWFDMMMRRPSVQRGFAAF